MTSFEITVENGPLSLSRTRWTFMMNGTKLALSEWAAESRPSRRHKFRVDHHWSATGSTRDDRVVKEAPPVPFDVRVSLINEVRSRIRVFENYSEIWDT
jgi:hypothetical protein